MVRNLITFRCVPIVVLNALLLSTVEKTGNLERERKVSLCIPNTEITLYAFLLLLLFRRIQFIRDCICLQHCIPASFFHYSSRIPCGQQPYYFRYWCIRKLYSQCIHLLFRIFLDHGGVGSDRISDDSSKEAVSDSHPDTLTDPEFSDPPIVTSSPPQSGDEIRREKVLTENISFSACFLNKSCSHSSNETRSCLQQQQQTGKKEAFVNV